MIQVNELDSKEEIPKKDIIRLLEKESPDFLAAILNIDLPPTSQRLNIPVILTQDKREAESANKTALELFLTEKCHYVPGKTILFSEFYEAFKDWLDPNEVFSWSKVKVGKELPKAIYPKGRVRGSDPSYQIGNISFQIKDPEEKVLPRLICREDYLVIEN